MQLVQELFEGPIDIIGECGTLLKLLDRLGYDGNGVHPEGRRLVFVGDLIDRGPDSPGVVRVVRHLIAQGNAQCVLGNHELNILRGDHKHGNHWFYGQPEVIRKDKFAVSFQVLADEAFREEVLAFFSTMPLALEREDVAVVHAMYHKESIESLQSQGEGVVAAFDKYQTQIKAKIEAEKITDEDEIDLLEQNSNPVKVLCSGMEGRAAEPFFAGGKMRNLERMKWWENEEYCPEKLVVIGHFWRRFMGELSDRVHELHPEGFHPTGADMFPSYSPASLLGKGKKVMCVDYAAGVRYEERGMGLPESSLGTHLAALRVPEMAIHLEDGRVMKCE